MAVTLTAVCIITFQSYNLLVMRSSGESHLFENWDGSVAIVAPQEATSCCWVATRFSTYMTPSQALQLPDECNGRPQRVHFGTLGAGLLK